jgi:hypothetical protein
MNLIRTRNLLGCLLLTLLGAISAHSQLFSYSLMDQPVNDLVYSGSSGLIYASVPSTGGPNGNHIIGIDPLTSTIVARAFAGSEPNKLVLTRDEKFLYVGLDGSASVKRFSVNGLTSDLTFSLGSGSNGAHYVDDMATFPGNPNLVAVSRRNYCCSPRHEGVALYDNGLQLPNVTLRTQQTNEIEAGDDGVALYGYNNETSGFQFRRMSIDQNGINIASSFGNAFGAYHLEIRFMRGLVYAGNGKIVDASTGLPAGSLAVNGFANGLALDRRNRRALFVLNSQLKVFGLDSMRPIGTAELPVSVHSRARLVRWGRRGIAYRIGDGRLAIAESLLVSQKAVN